MHVHIQGTMPAALYRPLHTVILLSSCSPLTDAQRLPNCAIASPHSTRLLLVAQIDLIMITSRFCARNLLCPRPAVKDFWFPSTTRTKALRFSRSRISSGS